MLKTLTDRQRGFTLIETVAVLVLIAIVSAFVMIRGMSNSGNVQLMAQQEVLKSHLRYAQASAMNTNKVWGVTLSSGSYSVFVQDGGKQNRLVLGEASEIITLPSGMSVGTGEISFDQWGRPYNNDTATGTSSTINVTVSYGGSSKSFSILRNTGFIP